jgi:hypothetical protein
MKKFTYYSNKNKTKEVLAVIISNDILDADQNAQVSHRAENHIFTREKRQRGANGFFGVGLISNGA